MTARTAADVHKLFVEYFKTNQIESLVELYEPNAVLIPQPGQRCIGHAAIRDALSGFLALRGTFNMSPPRVIESAPELAPKLASVALLFADWTLTGTAPDGTAVSLAGQTSDVVRQQPDGTWRYVIDSPFGAAGAPV